MDLIQLKEPEHSRECWSTTKACAYEPSTITIAVRSDLIRRAPDVVEMLRSYELNIDRYKEVGKWRRENRNAGMNDTALWWLKSNEDLWATWVTSEAADSIRLALKANEIPDGWPTE